MNWAGGSAKHLLQSVRTNKPVISTSTHLQLLLYGWEQNMFVNCSEQLAFRHIWQLSFSPIPNKNRALWSLSCRWVTLLWTEIWRRFSISLHVFSKGRPLQLRWLDPALIVYEVRQHMWKYSIKLHIMVIERERRRRSKKAPLLTSNARVTKDEQNPRHFVDSIQDG